ncbi:hypothetical protein Tco_0184244 [Tanacetum coccineum]
MECYNSCESGHGLYYSSCEDDYKLLVLAESGNVYIYSLKSDSWRKLNKKAPFQEKGFCWSPDGDIWSKVVTYQLGPNDDIGYMYPLHLMSNRNWLMQEYIKKGHICQVELKKKYSKDEDDHDEYKLYYSNVEDYTAKVKYTEMFVSPNQYMK